MLQIMYSPDSVRIGGKSLSEALIEMNAHQSAAETQETNTADEPREQGPEDHMKVSSFFRPSLY